MYDLDWQMRVHYAVNDPCVEERTNACVGKFWHTVILFYWLYFGTFIFQFNNIRYFNLLYLYKQAIL